MEKKLPQSVDGISGGDNITKMWKDKYSGILNDVDDTPDKEDLRQMLADSPRGQIKLTCAEELLLAANELPNNKSSGLDKISS